MRLTERGKRTLYLRRRAAIADAYGEPIPAWEAPVTIRAICQPAAGALDAQVYGKRVKAMYTLLLDGMEAVRPGDGLCIHVDAGSPPDYEVTSVRGWEHQAVDAELIAPERREAVMG